MNDIDPLPCCICNKCTCNVTQRVFQRQQDKRLIQFMMKLNEKFNTVRGNILIQRPPPTISNFFLMFTQEERHQNLSHSTTHTESLAFFADNKCFTKPGSKPGFTSSKGNTGPPAAKKGGQYYCTNCKISGHSVERCFKIHGYPPNFNGNKDRKIAAAVSSNNASTDNNSELVSLSSTQYQQLMALLNNQSTGLGSNDASQHHTDHALLAGKICLLADNAAKYGWLIDRGATDHICLELSLFCTYKPVTGKNEFIVVPDGRKIAIAHSGSDKVHDKLFLNNVLHISDFCYNLISVQKLCTDLNCSVMFNAQDCILQDLSKKEKPMLLGKFQGGLYNTVPATVSIPVEKRSFLSIKEDSSLWHLRLGHLPFNRLHLIPALSTLHDSSSNLICQICPLAKQTRASFHIVVARLKLLLSSFTWMYGVLTKLRLIMVAINSLLWLMILVVLLGFIC